MAQNYENRLEYSYKLPENHPVVSLIYLLLLMLGGALSFTLIGFVLGIGLYGTDLLKNMDLVLSGNEPGGADFLKIIQTSSSLGMFVLPPLLLALIEKRRTRYFNFKPVQQPLVWIFTILVVLAASPLLEYVVVINEKMQLPHALAGLESWMKSKELELEKITRLLLATTSYGGLLFNLLMIAVIPAIGEEFVFRGAGQRIFTRWTGNAHIAIWLTAIIFSAIHLQFYGFLPRMLLGALFGYLLFWSGSIWLPVVAHFINNASVVVYTFILQRQGKPVDNLELTDNPSWYLVLLSIVVTGYLLYRFWQLTRNNRRELVLE